MRIEFQNVLPFPLEEYPHDDQSVWKRSFELSFPNRILLNASSGKGKTTFVNILYGLRKDYTGSISIDGNKVASMSLHDWIELRKKKLSVIFQDLQLFPKLTAWENLTLKNDLCQHKSDDEIQGMLELLGIGEKRNQLCATLSLGQQQRVSIIRSLLQPYELLLMDEPFSHLDEENGQIALKLIIEETEKNGGGFILTTLGSHHSSSYDQELTL